MELLRKTVRICPPPLNLINLDEQD